MKKTLLTFAAVASAGLLNQASAQLALTNFNSGLPSTWSTINVDGKTISTSLVASIQSAMSGATGKGWMTWPVATGDSAMLSTSMFTPTGAADRWLVSPSFTVNGANSILSWSEFQGISGKTDVVEIRVSPTAGATAASFTSTIATSSVTSGGFVTKGASLSAYNGQTIRVAFRITSNNQGVAFVDNVQSQLLASATDAELTSLNPAAGSPLNYGPAGTTKTVGGTITNKGAANITGSYTIKYQQGSNTPVSQTFTAPTGGIPPLGTANFTMSTPYTIPSVGSFPVKVWVELTGDAVHTNDTVSTVFGGSAFTPTKKLLVEEATGTWCGWCVRGIVYMDSLWGQHSSNVSLVAVHDQDPMMVSAYDSYIGTQISGYPSVVIDRREVADPSDLFDVYNAENNYFGFADITIGSMTISGTNLTVPVTVKPAINLSGDYRLVLVLTEDGAHGTTNHNAGTSAAWDQHNYYSSASQNIALSGQGVNYQTLPEYIPATSMFYNFVARSITPSTTGTAGVLPTSMTANSTYSANLTGTLNSAWVTSKMRAVVMLVRASDGNVLNSNWAIGKLGVTNVAAGVKDLALYPNPTSETAIARFNLDGTSHVNVQLIDAMGRVVSTVADQTMSAGEQEVTINTSGIASGLYNVRITTEKGSMTQRLSVIK